VFQAVASLLMCVVTAASEQQGQVDQELEAAESKPKRSIGGGEPQKSSTNNLLFYILEMSLETITIYLRVMQPLSAFLSR